MTKTNDLLFHLSKPSHLPVCSSVNGSYHRHKYLERPQKYAVFEKGSVISELVTMVFTKQTRGNFHSVG